MSDKKKLTRVERAELAVKRAKSKLRLAKLIEKAIAETKKDNG